MEESVYASPNQLGKLSAKDAAAFLARIGLPETLLQTAPSFALLHQLQLAHLTAVPFDTSALHITNEAWNGDPTSDVLLGQGSPVELGAGAFDRIVKLSRGSYCFGINGLLAAFLRSFGFRVSELAARVFANLGADPRESGHGWLAKTHECLVVDWEGSEARYFVDAGFGGPQCPHPIELKAGATSSSINPSDAYELRLGPLPHDNFDSLYPDWTPHWQMWRWSTQEQIANPSNPSSGFWTPLYAFTLQTVAASDFEVANHFHSTSTSAPFVNFFLVTRLNKDGTRSTLQYRKGMEKDEGGRRFAKFITTGGKERKHCEPQWIEMKIGPLRAALAETFGFKF